MPGKIILIDHHDNPKDDRVAVHLSKMGFDLDLRRPFRGEELPEIDQHIAGAVIYGGEQNVTEIDNFPFLNTEVRWIRSVIESDLPLLGICLGAQLIAHTLGANVDYHKDGLCEFGYYEIQPTVNSADWFPDKMFVTQAHFQQFELPSGAVKLASGSNFPNQAFRYNGNVFALQFHPEVTIEIFRRWQNSDWAYFDHPGAQTRQQQDALIDTADEIQGHWFNNFLNSVFGTPILSDGAVRA